MTGVVAQYLEANPTKTSAEVQSWIVNNATMGQIHNYGGNGTFPMYSNNRILYTNL